MIKKVGCRSEALSSMSAGFHRKSATREFTFRTGYTFAAPLYPIGCRER